jgi:hypothetical protein
LEPRGTFQEQTGENDVLLTHLRTIVRRQPNPRRQVDKLPIVLRMYSGMLTRVLLLVGVGCALLVATVLQPGSALLGWVLGVFFAAGALFFALAPAAEGLSLVERVREGVLAKADVLEVRRTTGRGGRPRVEGHRIVHHPFLGDFAERFSIAAPWIDGVTPGSKMEILAAPKERRTWLTLGYSPPSVRTSDDRINAVDRSHAS